MSIITISGLDGSGKSTQIELLKNYLESRDKTFFYFHAVEFSVGNLGIRSLKNRRDRIPSVTKSNWLQIQLRKIALLIDVCRFKRLMKKKKVDYIISDRYFYDSVVNINYLETRFPSTRFPSKLFAEKYIPKPDFAFYIDAKPEIIMQRDRKPDQGLEYLLAKEKIFSDKIKDWDMIVVDGEKNKDVIKEEIIREIN